MKHNLPQSYDRLIEQQAAPLRVLLKAYATQYRAALAEIYEKEWSGSSWPFLSGREYQLWTPLLMHTRLIANLCGDKGKEFEAEAVAVMERFTRRKADLVIADDWSSGLALELLEALEQPLAVLEVESAVNAKWRDGDHSWMLPSDLLKDLLEKESWSLRLEKSKTDKGKATKIGSFVRSFQPEWDRCDKGTRYRLLDLALRLLRHLPAKTAVTGVGKEPDGKPRDIRAMTERMSLTEGVTVSGVSDPPEGDANKATTYKDPLTPDTVTPQEGEAPCVSVDPPGDGDDGDSSGDWAISEDL